MDQFTDYHGRDDYQRIEHAIEFLAQDFRSQPRLEDVAASVHLSKYHFLRLFKRWAGVTPPQILALPHRRIRQRAVSRKPKCL